MFEGGHDAKSEQFAEHDPGTGHCGARRGERRGFSGLVVFGDSLSDVGNLYLATEQLFPVYCDDYTNVDDPRYFDLNGDCRPPIPSAQYYVGEGLVGQFTNGENWADILSRRLGLPSVPSFYEDGINYANGGARTDYNTVEFDSTKPPEVQSLAGIVPQGNSFDRNEYLWTLNGQAADFALRMGGGIDPTKLYVVFSGANDLVDITFMTAFGIVAQPSTWIEGVLTGIREAIAVSAEAGAQDIVVPNMPDLAVVPGIPSEIPLGPSFSVYPKQIAYGLSSI